MNTSEVSKMNLNGEEEDTTVKDNHIVTNAVKPDSSKEINNESDHLIKSIQQFTTEYNKLLPIFTVEELKVLLYGFQHNFNPIQEIMSGENLTNIKALTDLVQFNVNINEFFNDDKANINWEKVHTFLENNR